MKAYKITETIIAMSDCGHIEKRTIHYNTLSQREKKIQSWSRTVCNNCYIEREYEKIDQERELELEREKLRHRWELGGTVLQQADRLSRRLSACGIPHKRIDAETGSVYLFVETEDDVVKVRISDHKQPVGGGFMLQEKLGPERYGEADLSLDPTTGFNWKDVVLEDE